jgi:hypothetical protein
MTTGTKLRHKTAKLSCARALESAPGRVQRRTTSKVATCHRRRCISHQQWRSGDDVVVNFLFGSLPNSGGHTGVTYNL